MPVRQRKACPDGGGQLAVLVALAHARSHGVDDLFGLELTCAGHDRGAHRRRADPVALLLNGRPALLPDRAGHSGPELQVLVGRIDHRVHVELGDVRLDQVEIGSVEI